MHAIVAAAGQAWPPFVLVAGLLLIGAVAAADGLFEAAGVRLAGAPLGARSLLLALLALVAVVSAMLNLDTAVVFLTPVLVHAARQRRLDERPFLYGSVFMANAGSLLLPGSNLTNLLVLRSEPQPGSAFAGQMLPAWITACTLTAAFLALAFRLEESVPDGAETPPPPLQLGLGAAATLAAAVLVVALPNAARGWDRRHRLCPHEQPSCGRPPPRSSGRPPRRALARTRAWPKPRSHRLPLRGSLAPGRARRRRAAFDYHLHPPRSPPRTPDPRGHAR